MKTLTSAALPLLAVMAFSGTVLASTPDMPGSRAPVVEVHALTADQAQELAAIRADYKQKLEALEKQHQEEMSSILGMPASAQSTI